MSELDSNPIPQIEKDDRNASSSSYGTDSFSSYSRGIPINIVRRTHSAFCQKCEKIVDLFNITRSAGLFNTDQRDIEILAARGDVHRVHNRKGEILICSNSLFECFNDRETRLLDPKFAADLRASSETNAVR